MKIIKYMMQVLVVGSLLTSCVEDADVTAYLTEDQLSNVAQDDPDKTFSAAVAGIIGNRTILRPTIAGKNTIVS